MILEMHLTSSYTYDCRQAVTTPVPTSFPSDEIGLMTDAEFLKFRDPDEKHHPSESYDFDIEKLNKDHGVVIGEAGSGSERYRATRYEAGIQITQDGELVAVVHDGIAYFSNSRVQRKLPTRFFELRKSEPIDLEIRSMRRVKYLAEVVPLVDSAARRNAAEYPVVLQHIIVRGEQMTLRAEKQPVKDAGTSLAIFNSEGLKVAIAQDEWGATLLSVAKEYRGKGLGKIIGEYWYEYNPGYKSGGFTNAGRNNALAMWRDRVREFLSRGWYAELIREGRLTYERVRDILKGIGKRPPPQKELEEAKTIKPSGEILVLSDDIMFVIYDRAFLEEPDEKFIHGYGFLRDNEHVGTFLYRLDYDRPFAELATRAGLELARQNGDKLYDGEGYHDFLEDPERLPGVEREGDYLVITRELAPLKRWSAKERRIRKENDPYGEKYSLLLEMAESKWA